MEYVLVVSSLDIWVSTVQTKSDQKKTQNVKERKGKEPARKWWKPLIYLNEKNFSVREICREEKYSNKTNILDFYIKTNDIEESKIKVLIDSGSDINCIHPDIVMKLGNRNQKKKNRYTFQYFWYRLRDPYGKQSHWEMYPSLKKPLRNHSITHS